MENGIAIMTILLVMCVGITLINIMTIGTNVQQRQKFRKEFVDEKSWIKYNVDEYLEETICIISPGDDGTFTARIVHPDNVETSTSTDVIA